FNLSQDQTLQFNLCNYFPFRGPLKVFLDGNLLLVGTAVLLAPAAPTPIGVFLLKSMSFCTKKLMSNDEKQRLYSLFHFGQWIGPKNLKKIFTPPHPGSGLG
ncbi:MAG: hypothetical protein KGI47_10275, partial [Betaproteobacteria bacterium]|nr:hypothetical protein [Betaproteobacteria bacterium]